MFSKLFAESGLSLDRLRALLEVGAAGSIVKAAAGNPTRQSQYSRQIKELEDFFHTRLIERQGKGTRLTSAGREVGRISRFFMLGLSNFQRGCLTGEQTFRVGAGATFTRQFLIPLLAGPSAGKPDARFITEVVNLEDIERRLHDLRLDFGVVVSSKLSRPLQTRSLGEWRLELWLPKSLRLSESKAVKALADFSLPLALSTELGTEDPFDAFKQSAHLICESFLDARIALEGQRVAALVPDFLAPANASKCFLRVPIAKLDSQALQFHLAWNPRLLRLNPHAAPTRDWLFQALAKSMA
jgi:DNA-binding transcriptional LysR family regulator